MEKYLFIALIILLTGCSSTNQAPEEPTHDLWEVYNNQLTKSKYVDLTHAFSPTIPVWPGFANAKFKPAVAGKNIPGYVQEGEEFTIPKHGFIASAYELTTDQYRTQLDPPAHWNPMGATISDLPPTYAVRPLVVIDVHEKVSENPGYHLSVEDVMNWETQNGDIPAGSVVMVRSDWHKKWPDTDRFNQKPFPGVSLQALQYLHNERNILFHGHEALDTDTTATLEGEYWLLNNHYCQAEGVANLDQVPEKGALISIGFAKPEGGTGGFARYIAICPKDWPHGETIKDFPGAPLPPQPSTLVRDEDGVLRPQQ